MIRWCYFLLILNVLVFQTTTVAQDTLQLPTSKIQRLGNYVTLKLTQSSDVEKLAVITPGTDIRLSPNASSVSTFSFSYRFVNFGLHYIIKALPGNDDDDKKGKSRVGGFSLGSNFKRWYYDLSYGRTKGFYLENTGEFDPSWNSDKPYFQFPDLRFTQYQAVIAHNFNPEYSINAVTSQSERQLKSAGSFIPQFRGRYYITDDRAEPLPNRFTQKSNNLELLVGAGYHYSLVVNKKFYLSAGLTPNVGFIFSEISTRYTTGTITGSQENFIFRLDSRAGAGYNSERLFTGIYMNLAASVFKQENTPVITEDDRLAFRIFIGYRFSAPAPLKKLIDMAEQKIGFK